MTKIEKEIEKDLAEAIANAKTDVKLYSYPPSYYKMGFQFTIGAAIAIGNICIGVKIINYLLELL